MSDQQTAIVIPENVLPEKMSLKQIIDYMDQSDEGLIDLTTDQLKELAIRFNEKIDNYRDYLITLEAFADAYKRKADEFKNAQKSIEKKKENLEKLLMLHVKHLGVNAVSGENYTAKLRVVKDNAVVLKTDKCDENWYNEFPDFVKIKKSYDWSKTAIKKAIKEGANLSQIAELRDSESLVWDVKKP
jgi:hypothetical protein